MYGCTSWTIKKAECQRIDAFELWCWRRLLRVPWTSWRSNQSIQRKSVLSIHWKPWCWSWCSNPLSTWCKELTHWKRPWCWARLKAGGEEDNRGWDGWLASPTQGTWVWASSGSWWWTRKPGVLQFMGLQRVRHDWVNWSELDSHGPTRLFCPWDFPGKNTKIGCHFLLHGMDLPDPGMEPTSPALAGRFFTAELAEKPSLSYNVVLRGGSYVTHVFIMSDVCCFK